MRSIKICPKLYNFHAIDVIDRCHRPISNDATISNDHKSYLMRHLSKVEQTEFMDKLVLASLFYFKNTWSVYERTAVVYVLLRMHCDISNFEQHESKCIAFIAMIHPSIHSINLWNSIAWNVFLIFRILEILRAVA